MNITEDYLLEKAKFNSASITVPLYDAEQVIRQTQKNPRWVHFGGGNLYRCFHAKIAQELLNTGNLDSGIIVVETFGADLIREVYDRYQNRSLSVVMKADGSFERELISATAKACFINQQNTAELAALTKVFSHPGLQMVTLTITEKGYNLQDTHRQLFPFVKEDIQAGPEFSKLHSTIAQLAYFLYQRYQNGAHGLAIVSTDNFSHNGDRLKSAIETIIKGWLDNMAVPQDFYTYVMTSGKISFPYSMIDRITPLPSEEIAHKLSADGIEGMDLIQMPAGPPLAAFVNTEEVHYLAIEDDFPNGRPPLEQASGVFLADRETVNKADLMKVTTCLNPLHTALAITGCLLGFTRIYDEVKDPDLLKLIEKIGYAEGLPVVKDPGIIDPKAFIHEVIYQRFMNPNIPDTPQRIATDTSQKLAIRYGETLKAYAQNPTLDVTSLTFIPFTIAAWCRYLMGIDDEGKTFIPSPDPLYAELAAKLQPIRFGESTDVAAYLQPILANQEIFGVNLYEIGLGTKIETIFAALIQGPHAVRTTLQTLLKENDSDGNDI